jgi:hypothetical protein
MKLRVYMMMEGSSSNQWSFAAAWVIASITVLLMDCCGFSFRHSRLVSSRMALHESPAYGTLQPALPPAMDLPKRSTEVCTHDSTHPSAQSATQISWSLASAYYLLLLCMHITKQKNRKHNFHILLYYTLGWDQLATSLEFPIVLNYIVQWSQEINKESSSWRTCSDVPYMVIPGIMVPVEDHGSTQATSWVDTSSCNGDGCQMHQVDCKPNGKRRKYLPHNVTWYYEYFHYKAYDVRFYTGDLGSSNSITGAQYKTLQI